jgi:hypothetical protein
MTQLQEPRELLCLPRIFVNAYGGGQVSCVVFPWTFILKQYEYDVKHLPKANSGIGTQYSLEC